MSSETMSDVAEAANKVDAWKREQQEACAKEIEAVLAKYKCRQVPQMILMPGSAPTAYIGCIYVG